MHQSGKMTRHTFQLCRWRLTTLPPDFLMATAKKEKTPDFEKLLGELDKIVNRMEQGDQSLDQTMKDFERGMELSEACQKSLDAAQQKVDKLVRKHGDLVLESVSPEEGEEDEDAEYEDA